MFSQDSSEPQGVWGAGMAVPSKSPLTPVLLEALGTLWGTEPTLGEPSEGWLWLLLCNECPPHTIPFGGHLRKKTKINRREATAIHSTAQLWHSRCGTSWFPTPGMAQPAIPNDRDPCPHLTWPLPAQPAAISSAPRCSGPGQQPDCSGELG